MRYLPFLLAVSLFTGCVNTSATMLGTAPDGLEPKPASVVQAYSDTSTVPCRYDEVAHLQSTGSVQGMNEQVVTDAKETAGEIGANAIIIGSIQDQDPNLVDSYGDTEAQFTAILEDRPCE